MYTYTLKLDENSTLYLLDKEGEQHKTTDILNKAGDRRVLAFHGQMGAGKTTFIKQLAQDLAIEDVVNSPTFAIINVYSLPNSEEVYHFDCYRLKSLREALDFGVEDYLYSGNLCLIEWPDILDPILPEETVDIYIEVDEDGNRTLRIE